MPSLIPIVLCGGGGTRLWPASRQSRPKQFLPLVSDQSLLQDTLLRFAETASGEEGSGPSSPESCRPVLVTVENYRFLVADHASSVLPTPADVLVEPAARNTAAAAICATLYVLASRDQDPDPLIVVLPADHAISTADQFRQDLAQAAALAGQGHIVCFGIRPDRPETGYGYIQTGSPLGAQGFQIASFREKPSLDLAREYIQQGDFLWNAGIFVFKASTLIDACRRHSPDLLDGARKAVDARTTRDVFTFLDSTAYDTLPAAPFDVAIMEKVENGAVLPAHFFWSDVGSWDAVRALGPADHAGNVLRGRSIAVRSNNCLATSEGPALALLGVDDLTVVATSDAVLVARANASQDVRQVVEQLRSRGFREADEAVTMSRPWGNYTQVDIGTRYQVKRLTVTPGRKLSMQLHYHRAEHWIVVQGTAEVVCGERTFLLHENQSAYIPPGTRHRLANPGRIPLHLIEVQSGSYLEEDDIVRYQDDFGR